jgi:hypothetical protein
MVDEKPAHGAERVNMRVAAIYEPGLCRGLYMKCNRFMRDES